MLAEGGDCVTDYRIMHYIGIRIMKHTKSMRVYGISTEYFWKFSAKLHCGNGVNIPYLPSTAQIGSLQVQC